MFDASHGAKDRKRRNKGAEFAVFVLFFFLSPCLWRKAEPGKVEMDIDNGKHVVIDFRDYGRLQGCCREAVDQQIVVGSFTVKHVSVVCPFVRLRNSSVGTRGLRC